MKYQSLFLVATISFVISPSVAKDNRLIFNPAIDMQGYIQTSLEAAIHRGTRRLTEEEFILKSQEDGVFVLDARSKEKYDELHLKGAVNLDFSDIAVASLEQLIPDKNTTILIYCNNNFLGAEGPFPSKLPVASLNLSTFISLYSYGYRNIYELGPLIDMKTSRLEFDSNRRAQ